MHARTGICLAIVVFALVGATFAFVPPQKDATVEPSQVMMYDMKPPSEEARTAWENFKTLQGEGWQALWNPVTSTPHRIFGKGIRIADAVTDANVAQVVNEFLLSNAQLLGADPENLRLLTQEKHGARWYTDYQQVYEGLDVIGGRVHIRLREDGKVTIFGSDFYGGIDISTSPTFDTRQALRLAKQGVDFSDQTDEALSTRLVVLPITTAKTVSYHLAHEIRLFVKRTPAIWRIYVDAHDGSILRKVNEIYYDAIDGNVTGYIKPMYISDPDEEEAFVDEYVTVTGYGTDTTDATGYYSIEAGSGGTREVTTILAGMWAKVTNNNGPEAAFLDSVAPGTTLPVLWDDSISRADERNAYYHANVAHARIKAIDPSFTGMDRQTPIRVNQPDYCNAYWDGNGITLGAGSGSCQNLAMFCDVIYHEYGHGITDFLYRPLSPSGAMHEAFSDYFACTITNEPLIGEYVIGSGYLRNLDNNLRYPDDLTGEVHDDGRILAGALWDMREALSPDIHLADSLFHYARYGKADNFFDYYYDVLETDDDDGDLSNGTPHYYEIVEAFGNHGIGPGLYINIAHNPIKDTEDSTESFDVVATITSNVTLNPDSLVVFYSTGSGYAALLMTSTGNPDEYSATIPAQSYGTTVSYYIYAQALDTDIIVTDPEGAPANVHTFSIGTDTEPPVIVHTPLGDQPDAGWPSTVTAEVTDNLGLASVVLEYSKNGIPQSPVTMTRVGDSDTYQATFGVAASAGDLIQYRIVATDASTAGHVTYEPASGYHMFGIAEAYYYTFESGDEGWTHWAPAGWNDEWHLSTQRNHTSGGNTSWKCGSTTGGDYGANLKAFLETPVITIGPNAKLVFWHWIDAETYEPVQGSGLAWDGASLSLIDSTGKASPIDPVDGYPYRILEQSTAPFTANKPVYSGQSDWQMAVFDLSFYEGECQIRFKFGSDGYVGGEGWYIDDVMIWSENALAGVSCDETCDENLGVPVAFSIGPVRPNPSMGSVKIVYAVPSPGDRVSIGVYDIRGRLAATLVDETRIPGWYSVTWNGENSSGSRVAPGIYFVRMQTNAFSKSVKVMLVK